MLRRALAKTVPFAARRINCVAPEAGESSCKKCAYVVGPAIFLALTGVTAGAAWMLVEKDETIKELTARVETESEWATEMETDCNRLELMRDKFVVITRHNRTLPTSTDSTVETVAKTAIEVCSHAEHALMAAEPDAQAAFVHCMRVYKEWRVVFAHAHTGASLFVSDDDDDEDDDDDDFYFDNHTERAHEAEVVGAASAGVLAGILGTFGVVALCSASIH